MSKMSKMSKMSYMSYIFWVVLVTFIVVISCVIICNADTNEVTNIWIKGVEYTPKPYYEITPSDKSNIVKICDQAIKELETLKKDWKK